MIRHFAAVALAAVTLLSAAPALAKSPLDTIAERYVKLSLEIGEHEEGYIDAYYGPAEWQAEARAGKRDLATLAAEVDGLRVSLDAVGAPARAARWTSVGRSFSKASSGPRRPACA